MPDAQRTVSDLPSRGSDEGTQLAVLLDTARELVSQEIDRGDRIDGRSRNQFAAVGALFAVVMATTAAILNLLVANNHQPRAWVYPVVGGLALLSTVTLGVALLVSVQAWRTRRIDALDAKTLRDYVPFAEKGNVGVAKKLIEAYAGILDDRRGKNETRHDAFRRATVWCVGAGVAAFLQLCAVFAAIISQ